MDLLVQVVQVAQVVREWRMLLLLVFQEQQVGQVAVRLEDLVLGLGLLQRSLVSLALLLEIMVKDLVLELLVL